MTKHIPALSLQRFKQEIKPACCVNAEIQHDVLQAMLSVPRHLFVDTAMQHRAYQNDALPIGYAQTISQPAIVAHMSAHLYHRVYQAFGCFDKVLEIGTGSGYQSAVLAQLWQHVYTIERIKSLHQIAQQKHQQLSLDNISYYYGDGYKGLPKIAPFQGIIVTACCTEIPPTLQNQLAINGSIIAPIEYENTQVLVLYQKKQEQSDIKWHEHIICEVKFVPMLNGII